MLSLSALKEVSAACRLNLPLLKRRQAQEYPSLAFILAWIFLIQASIAVVLLANLVPPLLNSDEPAHMNRVDQIASGKMLAKRYNGPTTSGGRVDLGTMQLDAITGGIRFDQSRKVSADMLRQADAIAWGKRGNVTFANTSIYSPLLYAPAALAVAFGKRIRLGVAQTAVMARIAGGLVCVGFAAGAIAMAGEAALLLFVVLSLPMSVSLFAAISQDGGMLAAAAIACALTIRISGGGSNAKQARRLSILAAALALLAIGRPAYLPLAAVPLVLAALPWWQRIASAAAVIAATAAWSAVVARTTMINAFAWLGADPHAQVYGLIQHPGRVWDLAWRATASNQGMEHRPIYQECIGILGSLDVFLPGWFYAVAVAALVCAIFASTPAKLSGIARLVVAVAVLASLVAIYALLYLTFTPVGFPVVEGVQGRYFLPLALMLPCFLPRWPHRLSVIAAHCRLPLMAFPTLSMIVAVLSAYARYY